MVTADPHSLLLRSLRGASYRLNELVHVCAVYLGIAVLVSGALAAIVPSLREQAREIHEALLVALEPDHLSGRDLVALGDAEDGFYMQDDVGQARSAPDAVAQPQPSAPPKTASDAGKTAPGARTQAIAQMNFANALRASEAGQHVPGLSDAQAQSLRSYISRKYRIAYSVAGALVNTAFVVARERGMDPQLILAVIAIESRYNPYAESHVGAQGLMQVMTKVHKDKFAEFSDGPIAALNPIANMRVGAQILDDCIKRRGSVEGGLACYVGATGPSDGGYGDKVLAERRRIALASGISIKGG